MLSWLGVLNAFNFYSIFNLGWIWGRIIGIQGFPDGSAGKESTCNAGDTEDADLIPGSGRSPEGRDGNPFQYSCLENSMDRGACQATVYMVAKSQT